MIVRGLTRAVRTCILYLFISTFLTSSASRNIQEENGYNPQEYKGRTDFMGDLKDRLKNLLTLGNSEKSDTDEEQKGSADIYESNENAPDNDFQQLYKFHATPHPSLRKNDIDYGQETDDDVYMPETEERTGSDEIRYLNTNEHEVTDDKEIPDIYIPDCDIPPYPDMLQKNRKSDSVNVNNDNLENEDILESQGITDSDYEQKFEEELIRELLDVSSGDMTNEEIDKTEIGGDGKKVMEETKNEIVHEKDDFLKKLDQLKTSLSTVLSDEASPESPKLWNIMKEVSALLEDHFGEVERMHNKVRVRDLAGRAKVKKIQDYYKKSTTDSPDNADDVLVEIKKARKRLKFITQNDDESLLPDYMSVMQELISMLKTTKNVIRGTKDGANQDGERLGMNGIGSSATNTGRSTDSDLENSKIYKEAIKIKLKEQLRKEMEKIRTNKREVGGKESNSLKEFESEMTEKERKKIEKKYKKKSSRNFGKKMIEDL